MRTKSQIKRLKKWLIDLDMTQQDIANECGVSRPLVNMTIAGTRRNKKVIDFLLSRGCPMGLLD
jgi:DNA-binding transcriptional regulator LsrR (DeoR family)